MGLGRTSQPHSRPKTEKAILGYDVDRQSGRIAAWTEAGIEVFGASADSLPLRVEPGFTRWYGVARAATAPLASLDRPTMCRLTALSGSECAEAISEFVEAPRRDLVSYANAIDGAGDLTDFLAERSQLSENTPFDIEIAVKVDGNTVFFYNLPVRDDIAQFSMFDSTGIVAIVAKDGTRRTLGLPIKDSVRTAAVNSREALMVLMDENGEPVQGYYLPLLHYR